MDEFLKTLQEIGRDFVENAGLTIARTLAFLVLGLVVIKIVQTITRSSTLKSSKLDRSASTFIYSVVTVVLYIALIVVLISSLGFSTAGIIAAFSAVALAIALALKDSLASLANGVIIIFTKPFKKGDYVQIGEHDGLIQDIRLFNTKILTYDNEEIIIPNKDILNEEIVNYFSMPLRRVVIEVPIPYDISVEQIKNIILQSIMSYKYTVKTPAPSVVIDKFDDHVLRFNARAWVPTENYWDALYDLREIVYDVLKENGVEKPTNRLKVSLSSEDKNVLCKYSEESTVGSDRRES
ncbi:MAG TPA: mechanosensitive ion channel family protein [Candidatus Borkfalkia excrementigallinarum]|uniref:Mechanosensitive ion channel family protein n=1 Tax=Candidatus Borkfalkia excrementigallinarum TaxID=2838506 RepID=A0A9D2CSF3_9FIRM|nr:mechanosensitive ion channel family protein [Candidatus Borkfalkia excrementigallinarum]